MNITKEVLHRYSIAIALADPTRVLIGYYGAMYKPISLLELNKYDRVFDDPISQIRIVNKNINVSL